MENTFSTPSNSSSTDKSIRSGEFDSSTLSNRSPAEHATVFAAPASTSQNQHSQSSVEVDMIPAGKFKLPTLILVVAPLLLALVGGVVFALFNVDALCEPLGLCDKDESEDGSDITEDSGKQDHSNNRVPGSIQTESLESSPQDQNRMDVPPVQPPRQSTQAQPNMLPDREEALW